MFAICIVPKFEIKINFMKVEEIKKLVEKHGVSEAIPVFACMSDSVITFEYQSMVHLFQLSFITDDAIHSEMTFNEMFEELDFEYLSLSMFETTQNRVFNIDNKGNGSHGK